MSFCYPQCNEELEQRAGSNYATNFGFQWNLTGRARKPAREAA